MKAYKDDLAYIHDVGFGDFARNSAPGLLEILQSHGVLTGLVVDLGCGSGIWARELVRAGYQVLGIDISPEYVSAAEKRLSEYERERAKAQIEVAKHIVTKTFTERKQRGDFTGSFGPAGKKKSKLPLFSGEAE